MPLQKYTNDLRFQIYKLDFDLNLNIEIALFLEFA
jgi:hypothetical protein